MTTEFIVKVDRTHSEHQLDFNDLRPRGFRPISLSVYQRSQPLYAAVWVKRGGPDWSARHGLGSAQLQQAFNEAVGVGFIPTIISATGPAQSAVFTVMFEQLRGPVPLTRIGLTYGSENVPNTIQHWHREAQKNNWIMTCGSVYGEPSQPCYAGIWPPNDKDISWNAEGINDVSSEYQDRFDAQVSGFARLAFVTRSSYGTYLSIFRDDVIGPVIARHELTRNDLNTVFERYFPLGFFPLCLQAGGDGASIRYSVILTLRLQPFARQWTTTGPNENSMIDGAVHNVLQTTGIRGAALAVAHKTRLVYAKGYSLAEPGYPAVLPTTLFRIASVSKTVTALAIEQLIEWNRVQLNSRIQDILQLSPPPNASVDPGFANITIKELLEHRSGLGWGATTEQVQNAFSIGLPITASSYARMVASQPLADLTKPIAYSNLGYWLLGLVVSRINSSRDFFEAIQRTILSPLKMSLTRLSSPMVWSNDPDEARYHRLALSGNSVRFGLWLGRGMMTNDRKPVPGMYGDRNLFIEDASGGLSMAVVDQARLIAALNSSGQGPILRSSSVAVMLKRAAANFSASVGALDRRAGYGFDAMEFVNGHYSGSKGGYLFSSQNGLIFEQEGTSIILVYNGTSDKLDDRQVVQAIKATDYSSASDLFPQFGMPSL